VRHPNLPHFAVHDIARMLSELYPFVFFSLQNLSNKIGQFARL